MIAVVQRVLKACVTVEADGYSAAIGRGLCVLLAVEQADVPEHARWMAKKLAHLRIFPDEQHRMNRSVQEVGGEILLVSQFTLAGDASKGNRPSFVEAADPELGRDLYGRVAEAVRREHGIAVRTGVFGATMVLSVVNDGPVTVIVRK